MQFISVLWLTVHFYSSENPKDKSEDLTFGTSNRIFLHHESSSIQSFNFSHNTVILVAMSDTWGINSPNTGDDKFFFPRWGNLHYVMKVDVMMMCFIFFNQSHTLILHTICSDNPRNTSTTIKCKNLLFFFSTFNLDSTRINFCYNVDSER